MRVRRLTAVLALAVGLVLLGAAAPVWADDVDGDGVDDAIDALDFPVVETGEIDGTVLLKTNDQQRPVSNVNLRLIDSNGTVVEEVKSQFDGFYLFSRVVPGSYILQVDSEQLQRLHLSASHDQKIELGAGEVRDGLQVVLDTTKPG